MHVRDQIRTGMELRNKTTMEIGPLYRPFVLKSEGDVIYVDHADTDTLRKKYASDPTFDVSGIVQVDAVWGDQTLLECLGGRRVDYVIASHVIEHVPNLIAWLQELSLVLNHGGEIRLVIPDKRFTFDIARRLTVFSDIIDAYIRKARRPLPLCVFDFVSSARYVDVHEAWRTKLDIDSLPHYHTYDSALRIAKDALETQNYHDVHCWVFTPCSFARLMREAAQHGLLELECSQYTDTPCNSLEFTVYMRSSANKDAIIESWRKMETSLSDPPAVGTPPEHDAASATVALEKELNDLLERERELRDALKRAQSLVEAYSLSASWRLTRPLRALMRAMRRWKQNDATT